MGAIVGPSKSHSSYSAYIGPADPYFDSVALLLNMDAASDTTFGSNGPFLSDLSSFARSITCVNSSTLQTAVKKYGTASLRVTTSGNNRLRLDTPISLPGDFTLEMWYNADLMDTSQTLMGSTVGNNQLLRLNGSGTGTLMTYSNGYVYDGASTDLNGLVAGTFYHYALTRQGSNAYTFANGVLLATTSFGGTLSLDTIAGGYGGYDSQCQGYIDEVRATVGVARYTSSFTPPTAPFPNN